MEEKLAIQPQPWTGFLIEFVVPNARLNREPAAGGRILFLCPATEQNPSELCLALFGNQIVMRRIQVGQALENSAKPDLAFVYASALPEQPSHLLRGWSGLGDPAIMLASRDNAVRSARLAVTALAPTGTATAQKPRGLVDDGLEEHHEDETLWDSPLPEIAMIDDDGNVVRATTNLTDYRAEYACRYVLAHYNEGISRDQIADLVHLSPGYFSNLFRAETGMSFSDYLITVRIENAKAMLRRFELSVEAISKKCGFNSLAHFSRTFKDRCGISPLKYRKSPQAMS